MSATDPKLIGKQVTQSPLVSARMINGKARLVFQGTRKLARNAKTGSPMDGGAGNVDTDLAKRARQAQHVNESILAKTPLKGLEI